MFLLAVALLFLISQRVLPLLMDKLGNFLRWKVRHVLFDKIELLVLKYFHRCQRWCWWEHNLRNLPLKLFNLEALFKSQIGFQKPWGTLSLFIFPTRSHLLIIGNLVLMSLLIVIIVRVIVHILLKILIRRVLLLMVVVRFVVRTFVVLFHLIKINRIISR